MNLKRPPVMGVFLYLGKSSGGPTEATAIIRGCSKPQDSGESQKESLNSEINIRIQRFFRDRRLYLKRHGLELMQFYGAVLVDGVAGGAIFGVADAAGIDEGDRWRSESPGSFFLARAPRGRDAFCERRRRFRPDAFHVGVAREYE